MLRVKNLKEFPIIIGNGISLKPKEEKTVYAEITNHMKNLFRKGYIVYEEVRKETKPTRTIKTINRNPIIKDNEENNKGKKES